MGEIGNGDGFRGWERLRGIDERNKGKREGTGERKQRWERREKNKVKREEREKRIKKY